MKKKSSSAYGILVIIIAYVLWGLLPIYWKKLDMIPAGEIVAHRIVWSCIFMLALVAFRKRLKGALKSIRKSRAFFGVLLCAVLITINWFVYIWAVNAGHMVDSSMGYYISPIVSVLFGAIILKERIGWEGIVALVFAITGVGILVIGAGFIPWIAFALAFTFALYGLLKKTLPVDAETGLLLETLVVAPFAIVYLYHLNFISSRGVSIDAGPETIVLLVFIGVVTAAPLLLFGIGARLVDLSVVGFMQYIAPTMMLILGVFIYNEEMKTDKIAAFVLIWAGLLVFTIARIVRGAVRQKPTPIEEPI